MKNNLYIPYDDIQHNSVQCAVLFRWYIYASSGSVWVKETAK
jgi:hypothetical protein